MPFANAHPSATCRTEPSGVTKTRMPGELAAWKVEAEVADVGVAPTVHHHVAPGVARQVAQVGMSHKRAIVLPAQEQPVAHGDDKQAPIRQEAQAHWSALDAGDDFALALQIDGNDLLSAEVGEPEAAIVPTR